jgi:hypothetical protein
MMSFGLTVDGYSVWTVLVILTPATRTLEQCFHAAHCRSTPSSNAFCFDTLCPTRMSATRADRSCFRACASTPALTIFSPCRRHLCPIAQRSLPCLAKLLLFVPLSRRPTLISNANAACTCTCAATKVQNHDARLITKLKQTSFTTTSRTEDAQDIREPQRCANKQIRAGRSGNHATASGHRGSRFHCSACVVVNPATEDKARLSPCISPL